jgi:two-component sensor histidine kinase
VQLEDIVKGDLPATEEVLFRKKSGETFNLIFKIGALSGTEYKILGYIITLTNITAHVEAEEKISASLKEKTLLLKEVHHRVKNNLQLVSSLLNIQASYIKDPEIKEIFKECRQRISSMALIHRKLYETRSYTSVYIDDYIEDLTAILCNANNFNTNQAELNFPSERINISADSAVPLGLIMNELLTNSFKHAFSGTPDDKLVISISKDNRENFSISVHDNGKGFPENIDFKESETLGLQLVNTLIEQLNGSIELIRGKGTEFRMIFPLKKNNFEGWS